MTTMCSSKSSSDHGRIRTETKSSWFCMVGPRQAVCMVTAVLVHLAYLVSYYLRWQLYSAIPQFPVFWPSEMTSATFCESSPTVHAVLSPVHRIQTALRSLSLLYLCHSYSPCCMCLHEKIWQICNRTAINQSDSSCQNSPEFKFSCMQVHQTLLLRM